MRRTIIVVLACAIVGIVAGTATVWAAPTTTSSTTSVTTTTTVPSVIRRPLVVEPTTVQPGGSITVSGTCGTVYGFLYFNPDLGPSVVLPSGELGGTFSVTIQIPPTAADGTFTLEVSCVDDPAIGESTPIFLGPTSLTVTGSPLSPAAAVTPTPFTG